VILMELLNIAALTFFPWIAMGWTFMSINWYSKRTADTACWSSAQHISPSSQPSGTCSQMILLKTVLTSVLNNNYPFTHLQHIAYYILPFISEIVETTSCFFTVRILYRFHIGIRLIYLMLIWNERYFSYIHDIIFTKKTSCR
jgi:hypothetical protein